MDYSRHTSGRHDEIIEFFGAVFAAFEGDEEGQLIAGLVKDILAKTNPGDMYVFTATNGGTLTGCIIFTRLKYEQDDRTVFMLSPVAVATDQQGKGVGQKLLTFGLSDLRGRGVDVVITYGDPNYYSKVGFEQITEQQAQPPMKLQYPHGWLAQSLSDQDLAPLKGPSQCAEAFKNPAYW
ncbi:GNAT family N-acetyltransferase [Ruegeria arenilitoris]|uniref:GNAT family N-acetyltransferase n=1 Tax=Ruegeria arenilitoris TaxID=1173585 RepID=UPI0014805A2E|nr:N-acetyltransferase [Ruegeria arenilitoris]